MASGVPPRATRSDLERLVATRGEAPRELQRRIVDRPPSQAEIRAWWTSTPEEERRRLESDATLVVGNLDGLPWGARVRANHVSLGRILDGVEEAPFRELGARSSHLSAADARAARLRERLGLLQAGAGFFERGPLPRFLLAFDPERSAIAEYLGPAIAEHDDPHRSPLAEGVRALGIFVPGNDSDLLHFEGKGHTMSEPVILANQTAGRDVAGMIAWQGGPFPRGLGALRAEPAAALAARLARFANGIVREDGVPVTAFGFSYGGAVVGLALRRGMRVDRVVHLASAGLGHGIRSLAHLPEAARVPHFAMLAPGDATVGPIQGLEARLPWLGRIGHGGSPVRARGVTRLETGWLDDPGPLASPASQGAAARRGTPTSERPLTGHMPMLERWGTTAKRGMSAVLAGGAAEAAAPRGPLDRLAERLGLPRTPIRRPGYVRRELRIDGPLAED
ncbi:hypothetical protein USB125703_00628 [Pseudoclavibacter triregionum]|nr:hypothetical protein USB125703_00628 [Pseudoclavibacter triregionum]